MDIDWDASWSSTVYTCKPKIVKKYKKKCIPKIVKLVVWANTFGLCTGQALCPVCKFNSICQMDFHCGHIVAEVNGGTTTPDNLIPMCSKCNLSMGKTNAYIFHNQHFK